MLSELKQVTSPQVATGAIYLSLIAAALGDFIPTPADAIYFNYQRKLKSRLNKGEITPKQYWVREAVAYYSSNSLYWLAVLGITYSVKGTATDKLKVALGLIGAGAVVGIIHRNIRLDEKEIELSK